MNEGKFMEISVKKLVKQGEKYEVIGRNNNI